MTFLMVRWECFPKCPPPSPMPLPDHHHRHSRELTSKFFFKSRGTPRASARNGQNAGASFPHGGCRVANFVRNLLEGRSKKTNRCVGARAKSSRF